MKYIFVYVNGSKRNIHIATMQFKKQNIPQARTLLKPVAFPLSWYLLPFVRGNQYWELCVHNSFTFIMALHVQYNQYMIQLYVYWKLIKCYFVCNFTFTQHYIFEIHDFLQATKVHYFSLLYTIPVYYQFSSPYPTRFDLCRVFLL